MHEMTIRSRRKDDTPALKALWRLAFGDSDDFIDGFFAEMLSGKDDCVVAELDGKPVSAMYVLQGFDLFPYRRNRLSTAYTYALATLPEYRGRGIGSAVYRAAHELALSCADVSCVLPAEESLYPFYTDASGAAPLGCAREARFIRDELTAHTPRMAARTSAPMYFGIREQLLSGLPHATLPPELYELMEDNGVEFFMLEHGAAAAETKDGVCRVLELLDPDSDGMASLAAVARWCRADEYVVRSPLFFDGPGERRPFMLAAFGTKPDFPVAEDLWWGLGMD